MTDILRSVTGLTYGDIQGTDTINAIPPIATIDLKGSPEKAAQQLHAAFANTGFAYVGNHGIPLQLIRDLEDISRRFFAQPLDQKNTIAMIHAGRSWRGYFPTGGEYTAGQPDQKEGLYFGVEHDADADGVVRGWPMHGRNLWPSHKEFAQMPNIVTEYMRRMTELGHELMGLVAIGLGLNPNYFAQRFTKEPTTLFRIFNYPRQPDPEQHWGVGPHTDMGFLTILHQDRVGGLQVQLRDGVWHDVPTQPGAFVINIGDMLQYWTHGIYKATLHRVKNKGELDRLSFPFFFDPHWQCRLEAIAPDLLDPTILDMAGRDEHRQRWDGLDLSNLSADLTYGEFVWSKIKDVFPKLSETVKASSPDD